MSSMIPIRRASSGAGKLTGGLSGEVCVDQDPDFDGWVCTLKARKQEYRAVIKTIYDWQTPVHTTYAFSATPTLSPMYPILGKLLADGDINSWTTVETTDLP